MYLQDGSKNAPLVVRNALLTKTPVIATNLGSLPEIIIENKTGMLFENENSADLASKIKRFIQNPKIMQEMEQYFPQQISIEENVKELVTVYKNLLN